MSGFARSITLPRSNALSAFYQRVVTALSGAGQFTLFSYFTPYYKQTLGSSTEQLTFLLMWFGAFAFVALSEIFQSLTRHWQLLLGGAIILLVIFLPGGLASVAGRFRYTMFGGGHDP